MNFSRATEIFNARQAHKETNSDAEAVRKYSAGILLKAKDEPDERKMLDISEHYFFLKRLQKELLEEDINKKSGVVC
jgi:hypothetical protein